MKTKRIIVTLFLPFLLLSLLSCGGQTGDPLKGNVKTIDDRMGNECFFGSTEEIRSLYDAVSGGDEAVKKYVAAREAEHEYLDDLSLVDSAAKARYLLLDILDKPIAVFPEETFTSVYYFRTVHPREAPPEGGSYDPDGGTTLTIQYNLSENWHYREQKCFSVSVAYNESQIILEAMANGGNALVETLEIDGHEMKIYMAPSFIDNSYKRVYGSILSDDSLIKISHPETKDVKEAVAKLHKARITTLREVLGVK